MAIPLYACEANGARIFQLYDPLVNRDAADVSGVGGWSYPCFLLTARFKGPQVAGYGKFRRFVQRVYQRSACVVTVVPWRDGRETGQSIQRAIKIDTPPLVTFPLSVLATEFQLRLDVSGFDAPVALGSGEVWIVPHRKAVR